MKFRLPIKEIAALLVFVAVVAIFVLPAFDMPDTALRAKALAQLIALTLAAIAVILTGILPPATVILGRFARRDGTSEITSPSELVLPLLC